jgi:hypothetical protein
VLPWQQLLFDQSLSERATPVALCIGFSLTKRSSQRLPRLLRRLWLSWDIAGSHVSLSANTSNHLHMTMTERIYYCHACADQLGLLSDLHPVDSSPSTYQNDKAIKHTHPAVLSTGAHSVLNSGSTAEYQLLEQRAYKHGFLEIDGRGVRALISQTTAPVGTLYNNAVPAVVTDSFRRVLSTDSGRAHGYPDSSTNYDGIYCTNCLISLTS